jgi:tRNA-modifying protein YgfZ
MNGVLRVSSQSPALLAFRGPDAIRFLNGQLTQDVRKVVGAGCALPSCVTDAKGKFQFRVTLAEAGNGALWVAGPEGAEEALQARLTRYLIADEVEVEDLTGKYHLTHFLGLGEPQPEGVLVKESNRFGVLGMDWWVPSSMNPQFLQSSLISAEELDAFRIRKGVPLWGRELIEGMLLPEALLDDSDVSYHKGCYIGQEVISRIKAAGKLNRRLTHLIFDPSVQVTLGPLVNTDGEVVGELTSVSPCVEEGGRHALGYLKRGAGEVFWKSINGEIHLATVVGRS